MRIVMFCHTLVSDWNHGNAHFLRGIAAELVERGHVVHIFEPADAWSVRCLIEQHGEEPLDAFARAYPQLRSTRYDTDTATLETLVDGADLVLVHEWNEPSLVARLGDLRRSGGSFLLLFHDTHHRAATAPDDIARYQLTDYDGVLAFGAAIRDIYIERGWAARAWTWHEAADTRVFRPLPHVLKRGDLIWIGNWGDDERSSELREMLVDPVRELGLSARVYGVRYPGHAKALLADAGIDYCGWLPNFEAPRAFAEHRVTVHVPRSPYVRSLPGIPTIRPFEAMACGIPLVSAAWDDVEGLFRPGTDYLVAANGVEMARHLASVLNDPAHASALARNGLETILARHTCAHRVDELLAICTSLQPQELVTT